MDHTASLAFAAMIADPTNAAKREAAIEALVAAEADEREAVLNAFEATYGPKAAVLRIPLAALLRIRGR